MFFRDFQGKISELRDLLNTERFEREKREAKRKSMTKGFVLGALVGGIVGVLYAPDKGENTRQKTKEELEKIKDSLESNLTEGKDKLEVNLLEGKEKLSHVLTDKFSTIKEKCSKINEPNIVEEEELEIEIDGLREEELE